MAALQSFKADLRASGFIARREPLSQEELARLNKRLHCHFTRRPVPRGDGFLHPIAFPVLLLDSDMAWVQAVLACIRCHMDINRMERDDTHDTVSASSSRAVLERLVLTPGACHPFKLAMFRKLGGKAGVDWDTFELMYDPWEGHKTVSGGGVTAVSESHAWSAYYITDAVLNEAEVEAVWKEELSARPAFSLWDLVPGLRCCSSRFRC